MFATHSLLTHFLSKAVRTWPDAPAVSDARHTLSYQELKDAATRIARELHARGVTAGDRVVLSCPNSVAFVAGYWGILASGAVAVPLNPGTPATKFAFVLQDCTPAAILADPSTSDVVETALERTEDPIPVLCAEIDATVTAARTTQKACEDLPTPPVLDQDLATIIYTSGSTGTPKGVMLSHLNMTSAARSVASYLGYHAEDRIFCAVPMTFDYGLHQITMAALTGAEVFAEPGFGQPLFALQHLAQSRASVFPVVPTMVPMIAPLADRFDLDAVRLVSSTAAALHPELIDALETALPVRRCFPCTV